MNQSELIPNGLVFRNFRETKKDDQLSYALARIKAGCLQKAGVAEQQTHRQRQTNGLGSDALGTIMQGDYTSKWGRLIWHQKQFVMTAVPSRQILATSFL